MSKKVYLGEDFTVEFDADFDLTGATADIKYKDPAGSTTTSAATITDAINGIHSLDIANATLSLAGKYYFWSVITDAGSEITISKPIVINVLAEGGF